VVADRPLTISGRKDETRLRLLADRQTYKVGEEARVNLHSRGRAGTALLTWEADRILTRNKVEKLLLVDDEYRLKGLITIKDIDKLHRYPNACKDSRGRLRVGAAVGVHDYERIASLLEADVDVLIVDSAHGHSKNVVETVQRIKREFDIQVVAGNVATSEGAKALADVFWALLNGPEFHLNH